MSQALSPLSPISQASEVYSPSPNGKEDKVKRALLPFIKMLPWEVPVGDYYMLRQHFAAGTCGTIHNCRDQKTGHPLVMKRFYKRRYFESERDVVQLLSQVRPPHGVKVYHCSPSSDHVRRKDEMDSEFTNTIVMEKLPALNIEQQYLMTRTFYSSYSIKSLFMQLLEYCNAAHKASVVNLDLKPANLIWHEKSRSLWVIDNSMARKISECTDYFPRVQTIPYRAPEVFLGFPYCAGTDIWSIPFIIYDLVVGINLAGYSVEDIRYSYSQLVKEGQKQIEALTVLFLGIPESSFLDACDPHAVKHFFPKENGQYSLNITKAFHRFTNWRKVFSKAALEKGFTLEEIEEMLTIFKRIFVWDPRKRPSAEELLKSPLFYSEKQFTCKLPKGWKAVFYDKNNPVLTIEEDSASRQCFHLPMIQDMLLIVFDEHGQKVKMNAFNINDGDCVDFGVLSKKPEDEKKR